MFSNNIENIYKIRKLQQLLFHLSCQQDTFFTQYLNHNSHCKQGPGNLVLTLDWNYVSVQISMHTHYFNSCTQIFQMFLALKLLSHGKVPPTVTTVLPIKSFATVCESQQWDLLTPPWFCNEHFFVETATFTKKLHKRHNLQCYLIWIICGFNFFQLFL